MRPAVLLHMITQKTSCPFPTHWPHVKYVKIRENCWVHNLLFLQVSSHVYTYFRAKHASVSSDSVPAKPQILWKRKPRVQVQGFYFKIWLPVLPDIVVQTQSGMSESQIGGRSFSVEPPTCPAPGTEALKDPRRLRAWLDSCSSREQAAVWAPPLLQGQGHSLLEYSDETPCTKT